MGNVIIACILMLIWHIVSSIKLMGQGAIGKDFIVGSSYLLLIFIRFHSGYFRISMPNFFTVWLKEVFLIIFTAMMFRYNAIRCWSELSWWPEAYSDLSFLLLTFPPVILSYLGVLVFVYREKAEIYRGESNEGLISSRELWLQKYKSVQKFLISTQTIWFALVVLHVLFHARIVVGDFVLGILYAFTIILTGSIILTLYVKRQDISVSTKESENALKAFEIIFIIATIGLYFYSEIKGSQLSLAKDYIVTSISSIIMSLFVKYDNYNIPYD